MKKIFTKLMLLAVAAAALVSCENNYDESTPVVELTQTVTLSADKTAVRTELIEGVPCWSKDDQIGVYVQDGETYKNYAFKNDSEEASLTTSFTGTTAVANTLFVYYPYTNFSNPVTEKGVKVEILANQEPTVASFDGRTDLMIAKPVTLDAEGKQLSDLEFARVAAIVKIVLKDKTGNLAGQHVSSLTMTAESNLVGRVYLDVVNQEINSEEGLYYGGAKSVNATYTETTQYEVDGENATYVVVYPQTLAAGSKLTFEAATEGYAISKELTVPEDIYPDGIILESGKLTTLNVSLAAENVIREETGLDLPIEDDFAWATGTSGVTPNKEWWSSDFAYTYGNNGELRLGKSGECGHITTSDLNLSEPFTVVVDAKAWTTETSQVAVTAGGVTQKSENLPLEAAGFKTFVFKFDAVGSKEAIKIEITGKRGFIDNLHIIKGHDYVLPAVLTVTKSEISVSHEATTETFTYSVANPVEGTTATVTDNVDWITTADNNGTVTVTVAANDAEEAREGVVTVTYGDLTKTVTVQQNAKPAEGGETGGTVVDVLNRELTGVTKNSTSYSNWSGKTSNSTAVYAGNSAGGNDAIQLRSATDKAASGVITTTSGGVARKVVITWQANTSSGRTLNIYGKNTAYSSVGDLRDTNECGTKLGTIVYGTSTELTITGNYQYIGLCSNNGAMYITEIQITWETGEGGGSTPEPATPVLSVNPTTLSFDAAAGSKTIACTIENEVSGVNVTATESVDWLSTSVSGKTVTVTAIENTTTSERTATVTIAYTGAESKTVTVSQAAGESTGGDEGGEAAKVWTLVTDASTLKAGDQIIIASNAKSKTASATITSQYMTEVSSTFSSDKNTITSVGSGTAILTLGGSAGAWTLTNESGKKLGATAAKKVAWDSGTTTWTISISSNNATIQSTTSTYGRFLHNVSATRFIPYTSNTNSSMLLPQIYRLQ